MSKKTTSIIGIVVGIIIVIIGFFVQDTSNYGIGESIKFGADFYTEMYAVTKDVGRAINYAINDLICAVGWLIIVIGLFDIAYFVCKMASCGENYSGNNYNAAPTTASPYTTQNQATPTSNSAPSIIQSEETAGADEWKCTCGKIHKEYETSCICGVTKREARMKNNQDN